MFVSGGANFCASAAAARSRFVESSSIAAIVGRGMLPPVASFPSTPEPRTIIHTSASVQSTEPMPKKIVSRRIDHGDRPCMSSVIEPPMRSITASTAPGFCGRLACARSAETPIAAISFCSAAAPPSRMNFARPATTRCSPSLLTPCSAAIAASCAAVFGVQPPPLTRIVRTTRSNSVRFSSVTPARGRVGVNPAAFWPVPAPRSMRNFANGCTGARLGSRINESSSSTSRA